MKICVQLESMDNKTYSYKELFNTAPRGIYRAYKNNLLVQDVRILVIGFGANSRTVLYVPTNSYSEIEFLSSAWEFHNFKLSDDKLTIRINQDV